jgi:hypothetical protein
MICRKPLWAEFGIIAYCTGDPLHLGDHGDGKQSWFNDMPGAYPEST